MGVLRVYKRNIVENKSLVLVSAVFSILIRLFISHSNVDLVPYSLDGDLLWKLLPSEFLTNKLISFIIGSLFGLAIMFYAAYLNSKYSLIRVRTYLVYVLMILALSCYPVFVYMNSGYIILFLFLICVDSLFSSYQETNTAIKSYTIGFFLALSSLFSIHILFYIFLFWIGFMMMRSFSFKSLITSVLGLATIYWLVFCFFLWQDDLSGFITLFTHFKCYLPVVLPPLPQLILLTFNIVILLIVILNNQVNSFQDKIRIRENVYFLNIVAVSSLLFIVFLRPTENVPVFYIFQFSYVMILVHFFALASHVWQVYMFYLFVLSTIMAAFIF